MKTATTSEAAPGGSAETSDKRKLSELKFPAYSLSDSAAVADAIYNKGGGSASRVHLAAYLNYTSIENGAFKARIAAARTFGLVDGGDPFTLTPLGEKLLLPQTETDSRDALVEAFLRVPLFKAVYDEFYGKDLPPEFALKNALRLKFNVIPSRLEIAHRVLMSSADTAGFFNTKSTQLIMPALGKGRSVGNGTGSNTGGGEGEGGDGGDDVGGGNGGGNTPPKVSDYDQLRLSYVQTLIDMMKEGKEIDQAASEKIERLLDLMKPA